MFIPLGDEPNPKGVPLITYSLIAINVAVYALISFPLSIVKPDLNDPLLFEYVNVLTSRLPQGISQEEILLRISAYDLVMFNYGFRPANPVPVALLTSIFLHGGFMHLAGNMLFLWIYGDNVEHRLGPRRFFLTYIAAGLVATFFHALFFANSQLPVVGASGAISGVLGCYFIWFPNNRIRLWIMLFPFFMNIVRAPARLVLGVYLVIDNLMPFLVTQGMGGGGVAYGAHIGGFIGGVWLAWWLKRSDVDKKMNSYETMSASKVQTGQIGSLIIENQFSDAATAYFRLTSSQAKCLLTPEQSIKLGDWLAKHNHPEAALVIYQRHLRDHPLGPLVAEAHFGAGLIQLNDLKQPIAAYQHLVDVLDVNPSKELETRTHQALSEIVSRQSFRKSSEL